MDTASISRKIKTNTLVAFVHELCCPRPVHLLVAASSEKPKADSPGEAGSESPENSESVLVDAEALSTALPPPFVHAGDAPPLVAAPMYLGATTAATGTNKAVPLEQRPVEAVAAAAATHSLHRCYKRRPPLLPMAAATATHGHCRCCKWPPPQLSIASAVAANGVHRCYPRPPPLLQTVVAAATIDRQL